MDVTIVIPVRNESAHISACLNGVFAQITSMHFEVIIIDSASTDDTVAQVKSFRKVRLIHQTEADFGHGRTRNLGVSEARGKWVVFLNGDAEPGDPYWLENLVRPLRRDTSLAGVFSRHLPRTDCPLYMQRDLLRSMPAEDSLMIREWRNRRPLHFSTVSAAVPRELWKSFPFDSDIPIAEDQDWARRVLAAGRYILYEPRSRVIHSHHYSPKEMFRLKHAMSGATPRFKSPFSAWIMGLPLCLGGFLTRSAGDLAFIMKHLSLSDGFLHEFSRAVAARAAGFSGRFTGWLEASRQGPAA